MNHYQRRLERLQRELERRQQARGGRPQIRVIEVWNGDELLEVMHLYGGPGGTPIDAELSQAIPSMCAERE